MWEQIRERERRFDGAADTIGRTLTVERVPFTIIGVTPPQFFGVDVGRTFDVAIPIGTELFLYGGASSLDGRSSGWLNMVWRSHVRWENRARCRRS
jgi:hypothetical protein